MNLLDISLLYPWLTALVLGLGLPILLLLYFLKLRRTSLRVGSIVLWKAAVEDLQVNTPFRRLKLSTLLILQILILFALALAAGRPVLHDPNLENQQVVILIDNSASMNALDQPPANQPALPVRNSSTPSQPQPQSRLSVAKTRAKELALQFASSGSAFSGINQGVLIASFAHSATTLTTFTTDRATLIEAIDAITPTDQPSNWQAASELLASLSLQSSPPPSLPSPPAANTTNITNPGLLALVITDNNLPSNLTPLTSDTSIDKRLVRVTPSDATTQASFESSTNLGIVSMSTRRLTDDPATIRVTLRLINTTTQDSTQTLSPQPTQPVSIRLTLNNQPVGSAIINIPPPAADTSSASPINPNQLTPAEATPTFVINSREGGLLQATISPGGILPTDDQAQLIIDPISPPKITLVSEQGSSESLDPFLRNFLIAANIFPPVATAATPRVLNPEQYAKLIAQSPQTIVANTDLFIFDRHAPATLPPVASMHFGAGLFSNHIARSPSSQPIPQPPYRILTWDRTHPLLRDVDLDTLRMPTASFIADISQSPQNTSPQIISSPRILARTIHGPIIATYLQTIQGISNIPRVVIAAEPTSSNFGSSVGFVLFMSNAIDYLTIKGQTAQGRWATTSSPLTLRPTPTTPPSQTNEIVLTNQAGQVVERLPFASSTTASPATVNEISLGTPTRAGVFFISGAQPLDAPPAPPSPTPLSQQNAQQNASSILAINLFDLNESSLTTLPRLPIARRNTQQSQSQQQDQAPAADQSPPRSAPRELWRIFLWLALLLLTMEWLIFLLKIRA